MITSEYLIILISQEDDPCFNVLNPPLPAALGTTSTSKQRLDWIGIFRTGQTGFDAVVDCVYLCLNLGTFFVTYAWAISLLCNMFVDLQRIVSLTNLLHIVS